MSRELHATKCRACMFPLNAATNCVPIFKEYKSSTMLSQMIAETIHILPEPSDNLGINVCKLCAEKIYAFYEFRLSYLESEKKLREMLHNFEINQRLNSDTSVCSLSNNTNDHSAQFQFANSFEVAAVTAAPTAVTNRFDCHECGRCFERELELRIHSHTHRTIDTPVDNDSQNGFDEQFLLANIKSEPVEYDLDPMEINPMEWAEVSQSDVDNLLMGSDGNGVGITGDSGGIGADDIGDDNNGELRWKCTICQEKFLRRAHLRAHRRQHAIHGEHRSIKQQNRSIKSTHDKKNKDQIQIKSIPQINHDTNSSSNSSIIINKATANVLKLQPQQQLPPPALPTPPPPPLPSISLLPSSIQLNLTADAQYDRWQCKKCFLTFRTRRLLRTHNIVHRNASATSLDFDASLLGGLAAGNESSSQLFDHHSDLSSSFAMTMVTDQSMPDLSPAAAAPTVAAAAAKKPFQQSPKSHSTPLKGSSSSSDARWKCPKCRKVFETPKALRKHKLSHHTFEIKLNLKSKNFVSDKKSVSFDLAAAATNSSKKRTTNSNMIGAPRGHVQRDWPCNSCHQVFNRRSVLREHRRTVHMLKPTALPMSIMKQELENFTAEEFVVPD